MKRTLFTIAFLCFALSGCVTNSRLSSHSDYHRHDVADEKLAEAATSIDHSLNQLAEIELSEHPAAQLPNPVNPERIGMAQLTSIDWAGPIEPLLKKIARLSHYRYRAIGRKPTIPILVNLSQSDTPIADHVRNLKLQVQRKARISVYPKQRILELRYLPRGR